MDNQFRPAPSRARSFRTHNFLVYVPQIPSLDLHKCDPCARLEVQFGSKDTNLILVYFFGSQGFTAFVRRNVPGTTNTDCLVPRDLQHSCLYRPSHVLVTNQTHKCDPCVFLLVYGDPQLSCVRLHYGTVPKSHKCDPCDSSVTMRPTTSLCTSPVPNLFVYLLFFIFFI